MWLRHKQGPQNKELIYALLDDQSDVCFIKDAVLEKLRVNGPQVQLKLSTVLKLSRVRSKKIDGLIVQGLSVTGEFTDFSVWLLFGIFPCVLFGTYLFVNFHI